MGMEGKRMRNRKVNDSENEVEQVMERERVGFGQVVDSLYLDYLSRFNPKCID